MRRSHLLYLEDILESAGSIQDYTASFTFDELIKDKMRIDAIVRNFEIIGEAASKISQEIKDKYPIVEWQKISDFRNVLAHEYFGIKYKIMWDMIKNKLPGLKTAIQSILEKEK